MRSTAWGVGGWIHRWKTAKRVSGRAGSKLVRSTDKAAVVVQGAGKAAHHYVVSAHPAVCHNHVPLAAFASATSSGAHLEGSG